MIPANIYLFKVNKKTPERHVLIVNFEHIWHLFLMFLEKICWFVDSFVDFEQANFSCDQLFWRFQGV